MSGAVRIFDLLEHQAPIGASSARFKVLRFGRRWGKDVLALNFAVLGHGPAQLDGEPLWKGLRHGVDIVWSAPDIPQTAALWTNEVEPRFRNKDSVKVNSTAKTVTFVNPDGTPFATLWVRSFEAIDSVRGSGAKVGGVIVNEAAHLDLENGWRNVLRPILMDLGGWAVIMSTTNAGPDGFETEAGKRTPSYFNLLCQEILDGKRGPEWAEFHGDARDNPRIKASEFDALVAEYPPDSPALAQEVYAKLIVGGAGLAFPEWDAGVHTTSWAPPRTDPDWRWAAGFDWGYSKPFAYEGCAFGPDGAVLVRREFYGRQTTPYRAGFQLGQLLKSWGDPFPEYIAGDRAMFDVSQDGRTIASRFQKGLNDALRKAAPSVIAAPKGPGSRHARKITLHELLRFGPREPSGNLPPWLRPKIRFHTDCTNLIRTLAALPRDPKGKDDVDTEAEDHAYDAVTYLLQTWYPEPERAIREPVDSDVHPGLTKKGERRRRFEVQVEAAPSHHVWTRPGT